MLSFLFALFLVPETKGLSLEQIDRMLEETTPFTSARWRPHSTFAADMHLEEKHVELAGVTEEQVIHHESVSGPGKRGASVSHEPKTETV